ncbi:MAG: hypothetical protein J0H86_15930 [Xanthomonadaceae bacterium]|nr:hypothetical protein [Xanthomonadaceae bacterium]
MAGCRRRPQWLSLVLLAAATTVAAAAPAPSAPAAAARPAPGTTAAPATSAEQAELLLYLSEFEDGQGDPLDPADLPPGPEDGDDAS